MNTLLKMHIGVSQFRLTMKDLRIRRTGNWARFGIGQNGELRRVLSLCMFKWASHLVVVATSFIASLLRHLTGSQNFHHPAPGKLSLLCSGDRLHSFQNKCGFRKKKSPVRSAWNVYVLPFNPVSGWKVSTVGLENTHTKAAVSRHNVCGNPPSKVLGCRLRCRPIPLCRSNWKQSFP